MEEEEEGTGRSGSDLTSLDEEDVDVEVDVDVDEEVDVGVEEGYEIAVLAERLPATSRSLNNCSFNRSTSHSAVLATCVAALAAATAASASAIVRVWVCIVAGRTRWDDLPLVAVAPL